MSEPVLITIISNVPTSAKITTETGYKLFGSTTGQSMEAQTASGTYKIDAVSGRDLASVFGFSVATSWPDSNPSNNAYSITLPKGGPFYMGYDTDRGLILGVRLEGKNTGVYSDLGIGVGNTPFSAGNWGDSDTYVTYSDGRTVLTNSLRGNTAIQYNEKTGKPHYSYQPYKNGMILSLGEQWRCFLKGTKILMADMSEHEISAIKPHDEVMAFHPNDAGVVDLKPKKVTKIFTNIAHQIIDLRGLQCTPGHHFLTEDRNGDRCFEKISSILKNDGVIIDQFGQIFRARTGSIVGSSDDQIINIVLIGNAHEGNRHIRVRAGITVPPTLKGEAPELFGSETLATHISNSGLSVTPEGLIISLEGHEYDSCNWPEGSSPFDTPESTNWVVEADGTSYTPPWIISLTDEDEVQGLRIVGAVSAVIGSINSL